MAQVDHSEVAKAFRQIPPRNAGSIAVEDGLDKQPVVLGGYTDMANPAGKQVADAIPLIVSQSVAAYHCNGSSEGAQLSILRAIDDTPYGRSVKPVAPPADRPRGGCGGREEYSAFP